MRRPRHLALFLLLGAMIGCAPNAGNVRPPEPSKPAAEALQVARWLPADVGWLLLAPSVSRLVRQWLPDRSSMVGRRMALESLRWLEEDLFSRDGRARVGLDPDGYAGAATVGIGGRTTVLFAAVADRPLLVREAMQRWRQHGVELTSELLGEEWLLLATEPSGPALLVGGSHAMLFVDADGSTPREAAQRTAALEEADSLAATAPFATLVHELPAGELWGFVQLGRLARASVGLEPELGGSTAAEAAAALESEWRTALGRAIRAGTSAETLVGLDESFRARRRAIRDDEEARLARAWVGPTGPLGISVDLRPNGLAAQALWLMASDAQLSHLIRPTEGAAGMAERLPERPMLLVQAALDTERAARLIEWLVHVAAGGQDGVLAAGPMGELLQTWDGSLGLAVLPGAAGPGASALSLGAVLGTRAAARARKELERWAAADGSPLERGAAAGEFQLALPDAPKMAVRIARDRVVLGTNTSLLGALSADSAAPARWSGTGHSLLHSMASSPGASLVVAFDFGLLALGAAPFGDPTAVERARANEPAARPPGGPMGPELSPAAAELSLAAAAIARRVAAIEDGPQEPIARLLSTQGGVVALRVEPARLGWSLELGWVAGASSIGAALETFARRFTDSRKLGGADAAERARALDELRAERDRLERLLPAPVPAAIPASQAPDTPIASDIADAGVPVAPVP